MSKDREVAIRSAMHDLRGAMQVMLNLCELLDGDDVGARLKRQVLEMAQRLNALDVCLRRPE